MHLESTNIRLVIIILFRYFQIFVLYHQLADDKDCQYDAYYSQGISDSTTQSRRAGVHTHLLQRLLSGSQSRCVGRGTTKNACHIGQGNACQPATCHCHKSTNQNNSDTQHIKTDTFITKRTEKTRPHLQSQSIYKYHQAKTLGIVQHLRVYLQPQVSSQYAGKENKGDTQRYASYTYFTQSESNGTDE